MQQEIANHQTFHKNQWQKQQNEQHINEDLIRLREMNSAFIKMNENYIKENQQYYSFHLQQTMGREIHQPYYHEGLNQHTEIEHNTERSNSLLFTLSEKDDDETRPATHLNHFQYDTTRHTEFQIQNSNKFGQFEYEYNRSMNVNNTILQQKSPQINVFPQLNYRNIDQSRYEKQIIQEPQQFINEKIQQNQGFSKYEQFAIKISRLFNIQVEDLEIIYNQLKAQKQNQNVQILQNQQGQHQKQVEISDSQVMKKLFDYALQIKNSHHQLKKFITVIDQRIDKKSKQPQNIQNQGQLENVSINFMLEEENHKYAVNDHQSSYGQKDDKTKRFHKKQFVYGQKEHKEDGVQIGHLQSKNTIIGKLVRNNKTNFQANSGQTIQSNQSLSQQGVQTDKKSKKSKKNSRLNEKIRLISQQLQSLKKQMQQEEQEQQSNQNQHVKFEDQQKNQSFDKKVKFQVQNQQNLPFMHEKIRQIPNQQHTYQINRNQFISKQNQQAIGKKQQRKIKEQQNDVYQVESKTNVKSLQEIYFEDPQIGKRIQETIKKSTVKIPSQKFLNLQQSENSEVKSSKDLIQEKKSQKIIVEPVPTSEKALKYSFKDQSFQTDEVKKEDTKVKSREKMFRSINQFKKSFSKEKKEAKNVEITSSQVKKTSNNPYLNQDEKYIETNKSKIAQNNTEERIRQKRSSIEINDGKIEQIKFVSPENFSNINISESQQTFRQINSKRETEMSQIRQVRVAPPKFIERPSSQKVSIVPSHSQYFTNQNNFYQNKQISFSQHYIQPQFHKQPSIQKRPLITYGNPQNLYSVKTVESKPSIQSERIIRKQVLNQPVFVNQQFTPSPKIVTQDQIVNQVFLPKNGPIYFPNNIINRDKSTQNLRISATKNHNLPRPVTPINLIKFNNNASQNFKQRSFSTQKLRPNRNSSIILPQPKYKNEIPKIKINNSSNIIALPPQRQIVSIRPNKLMSTQRATSKSIQKKYSNPKHIITPQKINFQQETRGRKVLNPSTQMDYLNPNLINQKKQQVFQKSLLQQTNKLESSTKEIVNVKNGDLLHTFGYEALNQLQTPSFNTKALIQQQPEFISKQSTSSKHMEKFNTAFQNEGKNTFEPKFQQSLMYYGSVKKQPQNLMYQQQNLLTSRKNQSVVHAFPVQLQNSQKISKMKNSVYAEEDYNEKVPIQQVPIYDSNIFHKEKQISQSESQNLFAQKNIVLGSNRPPKYVPPKQNLQNVQISNQIKKNSITQSKPLRQVMYGPNSPPVKTYTLGHLVESKREEEFVNQSRKSNAAVKASVVKKGQQQLSDSTPSFGVFNDDLCAQTMFVNPFSKPLIDSRNSSQSKRSAVSSRSKSGKKGITLESKRQKSPSHKYYQSTYNN